MLYYIIGIIELWKRVLFSVSEQSQLPNNECEDLLF